MSNNYTIPKLRSLTEGHKTSVMPRRHQICHKTSIMPRRHQICHKDIKSPQRQVAKILVSQRLRHLAG